MVPDLYVGGPGAAFWMWIMAIIGASSAFVESTLAQIYKVREPDGSFKEGPAYYIERALHSKWLGIKRGLYSNEAGMGSAPNASASAEVTHPAKQGLAQIISVYIDTLMICTSIVGNYFYAEANVLFITKNKAVLTGFRIMRSREPRSKIPCFMNPI